MLLKIDSYNKPFKTRNYMEINDINIKIKQF